MAIKLLFEKTYAEIIIQHTPANAYEINFMTEFNAVLKAIDANPKISVVLIRSEIEKFFCAGAHLKVFGQNTVEQNNLMVEQARKVTKTIENSDKVFIAAINGHCLGGGLEMALACDFRIAKEGDYLIGLPEINIGLIPGNGGTQRLLRLIGQSKALELLLSRKNIGPQKAFEIGLVNEIMSKENWMYEVNAYADHLAKGPQLAMTATKKAILKGAFMSLEDGLKLENELLKPLEISEDFKEGIRAFAEKRKPIFNGK